MSILETRRQHWRDESDCERCARALAGAPGLGDALVELHGTLGAGKTTFVRHLLRALGATGRIKSPTYALMEVYELPGFLAWHFDFYRFNDPQEWEDAGFRDVFAGPGLKLVEWPQQAAGLLPQADLRMELQVADGLDRAVTFQAFTPRGVMMMPSADAAP